MRTRSQSRSRNNSPQREALPAIIEPLRIELPFLEDQFQEDTPPESPMVDNRSMAQLLQAPTEGYEDAIVIPEITANNFELKHGQLHRPQVNQAPVYQAPIPQTQRVSQMDFESYVKANDAILRNMQSQGTLPGNTITNPKEDLKGITTRSDVAYQGPKTPSPSKQGTK
nr:reverse transcriptase domain-containing protein [Tanacetum cinerariifolium]